MQGSQTANSLYGKEKTPDQAQTLSNADDAILDVEEITLTSGELTTPAPEAEVTLNATPVALVQQDDTTPAEIRVSTRDPVSEAPTTAPQTAETTCDIIADARPMAAAMVNLTLAAPCLPNERVTVLHDGLLFNELTDENGALDTVVPALSRAATFVVAFSNGEGGVAQTTVEEIDLFDRVAVQWKGATGFELHAREYGADYGDPGHVWGEAARDMSWAVTGQGGFIARLGDTDVADGLMAEVYTFPTSIAQDSGEVALSVEAQVGDANCGLEIEAETLQSKRGADITSRNVTLSVPDCDAAGNFLVLNNLFQDLKVAAN
ncbi:hypothetical protein [Sulfitobacter albidus]|nr:hypothetical protein [Sulfitobacter albidus]